MMVEDALRVGADPHRPHLARLMSSETLAPEHKLFRFEFCDQAVKEAFAHKPGQFVMLNVFGVGEAPISISSSPTRDGLELCVRDAGRVTNALHRLEDGATVGLRGPYGNGFPVEDMKGSDILFVAGGLGMAPLRSVLVYVLDNRDQYGEVTLLYGTRTPEDLLFKGEVAEWDRRDDLKSLFIVEKCPEGQTWDGKLGMITALFDKVELPRPAQTWAAVCGPPVMYKFVLQKVLPYGMPRDRILMSLERKMHCGIGKCAHCITGHKFACTDGPVFTYWDAMNMPEMV